MPFYKTNPPTGPAKQHGDVADVDINAHIHAPVGINMWAGTDRQGVPIRISGQRTLGHSAGHEADKCAEQPEGSQAVYKGLK